MGPLSITFFAGLVAVHPDLFGRPLSDLVQGHLQVDLEIPTAHGPGSATTTSGCATKDIAETEPAHEVAEDLEGVDVRPAEAARPGTHTCVPELIVARPLLGVGEDGIGLADLFEPIFCLPVPLIAVRVVFHRQLAVSLLHLFGGCALVNFQYLVIVALGCQQITPFRLPGRQ